jgi:hypothetical protein
MARLLRQSAVAVLIFGAGCLVGHAVSSTRTSGVFRLFMNLPAGETSLKCEGCQFLSWTNGQAAQTTRAVTLSCAEGPCLKAVGAVLAPGAEPQLIAQSGSVSWIGSRSK